MLCFLFVPAFEYKIYCLMLYHLLKSSLHSKANACNIGTFIRFYIQMRVEKKKHLPIDSIGHSHNSALLFDKSLNKPVPKIFLPG